MTPQEIEMWLQRLQSMPQQQQTQQPGAQVQPQPQPQMEPQGMPQGMGQGMPGEGLRSMLGAAVSPQEQQMMQMQQRQQLGSAPTERELFEMATRARR